MINASILILDDVPKKTDCARKRVFWSAFLPDEQTNVEDVRVDDVSSKINSEGKKICRSSCIDLESERSKVILALCSLSLSINITRSKSSI